MLTLTDAFTGTGALLSDGRKQLAQVLGCGRTELLEVALGDLHDRAHRRRLRDAVVSATATPEVQARLALMSFGDLGPGSKFVEDSEVGIHECPARLHGVLEREEALRWSVLLAKRVEDVSGWASIGANTVADLIGLVFERSLQGLAAIDAEPPVATAALDLALLLDHEGQLGGATPALSKALRKLSSAGQPPHVRDAAARLLRTMPRSAGHLDTLNALLTAAGDARDVDVFARTSLLTGRHLRLEEVGRSVGLSAERTRQLRRRAEGRVRSAAGAAPIEFRQLVTAVGAWLGAVAPIAAADQIAERIGAGSSATRAGALLLWLAGPYQPVTGRAGWLGVEPAGFVARTDEWLSEDGGVRPVAELHAELAAHGLRSEHRDAWLATFPTIRVDDMVMRTDGSLGVVLERVLFAVGRGQSAVLLADRLGLTERVGEVREMLRRDRRFVRVAPDEHELAEWGGCPFVADPHPSVRDGRLWFEITVGRSTLRGEPQPLPRDIFDELVPTGRVEPEARRRTFASRYGPVIVSDIAGPPAISSLRHIALACGARTGDGLSLGFDLGFGLGFNSAGDVTVHRKPGSSNDVLSNQLAPSLFDDHQGTT